MLEVFIDQDRQYLAWLAANPGGYVVNTYRSPSPNYLKLHLSACRTISGNPTRGRWCTKDYAQVCSPIIGELTDWATREVGGKLEPCGTCLRSLQP
jgi:hypothetical protein